MTLTPSTTLSGKTVQANVSAIAAAPTGGLTLTLTSSSTAVATVPATVSIPAGQTSVTFTVTTIAGSNGSPTISATANGVTVSSKLTVQSPIAHTAWSLKYVDSQETSSENAPATNAFDGNTATFWHTQWSAASPPPPHEIQINLGASYVVNGFTYLPRQDGCSNGTIGQYEFYVSTDGVNWGTPVASGTFNYGTAVFACGGATVLPAQQINFTAATGSYVRLRALSEVSGNPWTSAAEINVLH